ncbi:MAG: methyltransferase domain-containing protein [Chlamydiales bacterium]
MAKSFSEYHLFQLLARYETQHLPLDLFLSHYFRSHKALGATDRRLISEAVYGMIRWKILIDHLIDKSPSWEKRYAIYRNIQPSSYLYVNTLPLHVRVGFTQHLFDLLKKSYGEEEAIRLCQVSNTPAPITIRVNPIKTSREALYTAWEKEFAVVKSEYSPYAIHFKKRAPLVALPAFKEGLFEIQDEASQVIANQVEVKPGEKVLDYCAGSGGKSLAFAHKMHGLGQIYLHDVRLLVLEQAKKRLKRAGVQNAQVLGPTHPTLKKLKKNMDWVLVDVPCSGTGTFRRNPDQKWKFSLEMLHRLIHQQREIFAQALEYLKPSGKIIYATCSLLKEENEEQVAHFLNTLPVALDGEPFFSPFDYGSMDRLFSAQFTRL